jgi:hypothetical protein
MATQLKIVCEFSEQDSKRIKEFGKVNGVAPHEPTIAFFHGFKDTDIDTVWDISQKLKSVKVRIAEIRIQSTTNSVLAKVESASLSTAFHILSSKIKNSHPLHEGKYLLYIPLFSYKPSERPQYKDLEGCFDLLGVEFAIETVRILEM